MLNYMETYRTIWSNAFKLKCFNFLNKEQKELDKGITNIEDEQ